MTNLVEINEQTEEQERRTYTEGGELLCPGTIEQEANGIRAIVDMMYYKWQNEMPSADAQDELYFALYGLKTLCGAHADHAAQLSDLADLKGIHTSIT